MSEQNLSAPEIEEVKRLQEKVLGFENLLQAFQKSQLEQTQALAAFVSHIGDGKKINTSAANIDANISTSSKANASPGISLNKDTGSTISRMPNTNIGSSTDTSMGRKNSASSQYLQVQRKALKSAQQPHNTQNLARGKTVSKAAPYLGNVSSTLQTFDQDISIWAELSGIDEDALKSNMKILEERFINISIPDPKAASDELRQAGFNFSWVPKEGYEEEDKPDDLRLPEFLSLVGGGHQSVDIHLRDFTDRSCEKVLYYEATDFEGLWQALARPRKLGMKLKNTRIRPGWDKISAYEAINEDGENNLTYGREMLVSP
ncbi:uncharacterized protein H6S33_010493 [Morchella sextelata]|uniref:uncharacterized protein n=1 Tax=Morchella sextelata TaxID=1174677 RepID=UPI001D05B628|nr:uncharacterized protein H6S33_010493 [Morchella sextelata]KAH0612441.1 hypothetical protein H6S33_010493 [Morchella sextelata]